MYELPVLIYFLAEGEIMLYLTQYARCIPVTRHHDIITSRVCGWTFPMLKEIGNTGHAEMELITLGARISAYLSDYIWFGHLFHYNRNKCIMTMHYIFMHFIKMQITTGRQIDQYVFC